MPSLEATLDLAVVEVGLVHAVEDVLHQFLPQRAHGFPQSAEELEPDDHAVPAEGLGEELEVVLFEEDAVGVEGLLGSESTCSKLPGEMTPDTCWS